MITLPTNVFFCFFAKGQGTFYLGAFPRTICHKIQGGIPDFVPLGSVVFKFQVLSQEVL